MTTERDDRSNITQLRLQLLANGYSPIPNRDKRTFTVGWPTLDVTPDEIRSWERRFRRDLATGVRIERGLAVIDFDIDHEIMAEIVDRVLDRYPQLEDPSNPLPIRRGKSRWKEAWFLRCDETFSRIHSRRWLPPGAVEDDGAHFVEVFGGASPRQFGAFGAHTRLDNGEVTATYRWNDVSLADVPLDQLTALPKEAFFAIVDIVEEVLAGAGWKPVTRSTKGESDAVRSYDITDDMFFDLFDGRRLSLSELREVAPESVGLRCSPSFIEGNSSRNVTRCIVGTSKAGHLTVWDSATGITHMEVSAAPRDFSVELNRVAEKLKELDIKSRNRLHARDGAVVAAAKLLETWAFCPAAAKAPVVPVWTSALDGGITMTNFRTMMLPHSDEEVGPKGGRQIINPVDIWAGSEKRLTVAGTQLRPDQPRPTFSVGDEIWVNAYDPPAFDDMEGGDASIGIEFMSQIAPDERERHWFLQWWGHKIRFPHIPGPGVVMVAHRAFGTGRGTLRELFALTLGAGYVKEMAYDMVAGRTYQSQYNAWAADALVVFVNESSEAEAGISTFASKRKTYERIKELFEPRPMMRTFVTHGRPPFKALACASYVICTNHADAIPIPDDDRRLAVLTNGSVQPQAYWDRLNAWMQEPANIAAFVAYLRSVDLAGYSPFAPPIKTRAKERMADEGKTDLDHALDLALKELPARLVTMAQILAAMRKVEKEHDMDFPDRWVPIAKRMARAILHRVGVRESTNWQVMIEGRKHAIYARDASTASLWCLADGVRDEVVRNDSALPSGVVVGIFDGIKR